MSRWHTARHTWMVCLMCCLIDHCQNNSLAASNHHDNYTQSNHCACVEYLCVMIIPQALGKRFACGCNTPPERIRLFLPAEVGSVAGRHNAYSHGLYDNRAYLPRGQHVVHASRYITESLTRHYHHVSPLDASSTSRRPCSDIHVRIDPRHGWAWVGSTQGFGCVGLGSKRCALVFSCKLY